MLNQLPIAVNQRLDEFKVQDAVPTCCIKKLLCRTDGVTHKKKIKFLDSLKKLTFVGENSKKLEIDIFHDCIYDQLLTDCFYCCYYT